MTEPKTVQGYISLLKQVEEISVGGLKGIDDIPEYDQQTLYYLTAEIANHFNDSGNKFIQKVLLERESTARANRIASTLNNLFT